MEIGDRSDSRKGFSRPAYLELADRGELAARRDAAWDRMRECDLCARYCRVDRMRGIEGAACRTGREAIVHGFGPHHGEEDPLRGWKGSGTVFFSWCNLRCVYCQNWEISQRGEGEPADEERLAAIMLRLQEAGCHNVNLVSPSHVVAQIIGAVAIAAGRGLRLPIVYNTGGYDSLEALSLLDGIVDIYMPDMKYGDAALARRYSKARGYVEANRAAVGEMHRQVGDLVLDANGIARRGLLVRHLVLPGGLAGTRAVLEFLAAEISRETYVNLMDQYRPCYRAEEFTELARRPTAEELREARDCARTLGLRRIDGAAASARLIGD